jgi:hypothetical protein
MIPVCKGLTFPLTFADLPDPMTAARPASFLATVWEVLR